MARYAFSDLHGQLRLYQEIKKFVKPDDELYCLGDCGDRGPQPWETIKAVINDSQVVYLKGNHEDLLVGAMAEYLHHPTVRKFHRKYETHSLQYLLAHNGGAPTLQGWIDEGADPSWIEKLDHLSTLASLTVDNLLVVLSHAGYTPGGQIPDEYDLIWDRNHLRHEWPADSDNLVIVHGHTPCPYLKRNWTLKDGAIMYANGHKLDIDIGAFATNTVCLLDLDTFDEHYFSYEPDEQS